MKTELLAGLTTFMTMTYILFVDPDILGTTGMDPRAGLMATATLWRLHRHWSFYGVYRPAERRMSMGNLVSPGMLLSMMDTSSMTTYVASAAGIAEGCRTGLITVTVLFLLAPLAII